MFCKPTDLTTESDVEQKLIWSILTSSSPEGLALQPSDIQTKLNIRRLLIGKGKEQKLYFPDYIVLISGLPVFVVEAKAPGEDLREAMREARLYATELNAAYPHDINPCKFIMASDGAKIVVGFVDSAEYTDELLLSDVEVTNPKYAALTDRLSRTALSSFCDSLLIAIRKPYYFRALDLLGGTSSQSLEVVDNTFGAELKSSFRHLFNPTSHEDRKFIAENAYVPSQRRHQYVEPIDRVIRSAVPPSLTSKRAIEDTAAPTLVINALKRAAKLENEVMLLIGSVGSGKSTFVDYLQAKALTPEVRRDTVWLHVNLNDAPLEEKKLYDFVLNSMIEEFQRLNPDLDFEALDAWKTVFKAEINRFTNTVLAVLPEKSDARAERLSAEYGRLMNDKVATVNAMARTFAIEKGLALIVVLDNCDKRTLEEQLLMFQVSQWVKKSFRCTVFLPLRDVTYELYKNEPPLDTALKDLVYRIEPPMFSKVLAQRIRLALKQMEMEDGRKRISFKLKGGVEVEYPASDRAMYLVSIAKSLFDYDRIVRRLITALAGRDVRKAMELFLEFCASGHISENDIWRIRESEGQYALDYDVVVRVLLRMNRRFYDGDEAYVRNIVQCDPADVYPDHLSRVAILRWLQVRFSLPGPTQVNGYHRYQELLKALNTFGHTDVRLRKEVAYLVRAGCIITEHQDKNKLHDNDLISISPAGWVHLDLLENPDYLAACSEDTWLPDKDLVERIAGRIGRGGIEGHFSRSTSFSNARELAAKLNEISNQWFRKPELVLANSSDPQLHSMEGVVKAARYMCPPLDIGKVDKLFGHSFNIGSTFKGRVTNREAFGVFVRLFRDVDGLIHNSRFNDPIPNIPFPNVGDMVDVEVIRIDLRERQIELNIC